MEQEMNRDMELEQASQSDGHNEEIGRASCRERV